MVSFMVRVRSGKGSVFVMKFVDKITSYQFGS